MSVPMTLYLRTLLIVDALFSGIAAIVLMAGAGALGPPLLALPSGLLFWAGVVLVPWVAALLIVQHRAVVPRMVMIDILAINALWVAASVALLFSGLVSPNALGIALVCTQALAVALITQLQFGAMRAGAARA